MKKDKGKIKKTTLLKKERFLSRLGVGKQRNKIKNTRISQTTTTKKKH